jgi:hypothetical protein
MDGGDNLKNNELSINDLEMLKIFVSNAEPDLFTESQIDRLYDKLTNAVNLMLKNNRKS